VSSDAEDLSWLTRRRSTYELTRFAILRALGVVYLVAFLIAALQLEPLIGSDGLLPVGVHLAGVARSSSSWLDAFFAAPTIFWLDASNTTLVASAWFGVVLASAQLAGLANAPLSFALWALYLSFRSIGQVFWGYGWEILLLEAGFLACFLAPPIDPRPFAKSGSTLPVIFLYRWLLFRLMFGAGLIKLRGDPCWIALRCLDFHYETQPNPSPLSPFFHSLPPAFHSMGVAFNHFVELVLPFAIFGPRTVRHVAGALMIVFQLFLIASGNLSFLYWLTIAVALACFDDTLFERLVPRRWRDRVPEEKPASRLRGLAVWVLVLAVVLLSVEPTVNLFSPRQQMNASFDPFHLVNTYGAFGSVGRERYQVVIEGTSSTTLEEAEWREYVLPCNPGPIDRAPCLVTPYHYRLDWQMWFAALQDYQAEPWIVHLAHKLLNGDRTVKRFFVTDPFPSEPPKYVRAILYRYEFDGAPGVWWKREPLALYLRPLARDDPEMLAFLRACGWLDQGSTTSSR
jgi:hypothetical protein